MQLASTVWDGGGRVVVLLHGMMGCAEQFWQVGPALAELGYRAVALDLPGHGESPSAAAADLGLFASSVVEAVGAEPELAIGHSLGAVVLAEALPALRPSRVVYVDVPLADDRGSSPSAQELAATFATAKAGRTVEALTISRPEWTDQDRQVEAAAARRFDVGTAVAVELAYAKNPRTRPPGTDRPSLVIRAEPSRYVSAARAAVLRELGFEVRSIAGAGHSVWYGHFPEFMAALDGWV
ncbi:alpha/beta hydrolase family protein [Kribbella amoyensis]|uniref:Alpha/beta hydrolase family protein n=1 Tax=Kribbella amoyensis TaxID=996641 RepID=A0A561BXG4_9ACTN|nr:alpha/beta fold hydrolase [Kribbella amoyensis]TWD83412.1 alpha/beta hydrolase family protein [Kribbella amoyensis]